MYQVTKEHIKDGLPEEERYCPLALSLKENLGWNVEVGSFTIRKCYDSDMVKTEEYYYLSKNIRNWIKKFDKNSSKIESFTFEIKRTDIEMEDEYNEDCMEVAPFTFKIEGTNIKMENEV